MIEGIEMTFDLNCLVLYKIKIYDILKHLTSVGKVEAVSIRNRSEHFVPGFPSHGELMRQRQIWLPSENVADTHILGMDVDTGPLLNLPNNVESIIYAESCTYGVDRCRKRSQASTIVQAFNFLTAYEMPES